MALVEKQTVRFGAFEVDLHAGELRKSGIRIRLADQPLHILALLLEHPGELVTREELRQRLWPAHTFVDFENGLNAAVKRLREALGDSATNPRYIETVPRHGYRFIGPATEFRGPSLVTQDVIPPVPPVKGHDHSYVWYISVIGSAIVLLLVLPLSIYVWRQRANSTKSEDRTIAVLPFEDMSPNKDQEYFADGLADELLTDLAKIPELRVSARTSSFQFRNKGEDLRNIAKKLNVRSILEGGVRKSGNRVRISVQLIDAVGGFHLWSETYDRELVDIFAVQAEIAHAVAEALKVSLLASKPAVAPIGANDVEAYNIYLQARYFSERRTRADVEKSISYYEQSLKLNPNAARTWAGLADARMHQADCGYLPTEYGYDKARQAAQQALALDANLPLAQEDMGWIKMNHDFDWEGANASYQRALTLSPGSASAIWKAAKLALTLGHFQEALVHVRKARDMDPLDTTAYLNLANAAYYAGEYDEASAALQKSLEIDPEFPVARAYLGRLYLRQGRNQEALAAFQKEPDEFWHDYGLALGNQALGNKSEADAAFATVITKFQNEWAYQIAQIFAYRGQPDQAFQWLDRAYAQSDPGLTEIKGDPLLKNLEHDPRYAEIMKKMKL